MKRIIAILMVCIACFGLTSGLSGCAGNNNSLTVGQWLSIVADAFGMYGYQSEIAHTKTVKPGDTYFDVVQIAYEWGLFTDEGINVNEAVTKGFAAATLVKTVGMHDADSMNDEELTQFAVDNHYVNFEYRGRTDMKRQLSVQEATDSIDAALGIWLNQHFETVNECTYADGVQEISGDVYAQEGFSINGNQVIIPEALAGDIQVGAVYVLPARSYYDQANAYKAAKVEHVDGNIVITNEEEPVQLEDVLGAMKLSGSVKPDFSQVPVMDGVGNIINADMLQGMGYNEGGGAVLSSLAYAEGGAPRMVPLASGSLSFTVDGLKIEGKVSDGAVSFSVKGSIPVGKSGVKVDVGKSYEIKNISLDHDFDVGWFLDVKRIYAKLNYTVVDKTSVGIKYEKKGSFYQDNRKKFGLGNVLTSELRDDAKNKATKTIKICSFPLVGGGVGSVNLDVKLKISVSGTIELEVSTTNGVGFECRKSNIRYIKDSRQETKLNIKAKLEATLYMGVSVRALNINLIGAGFEGGIGVEGKAVISLVDQENHQIETLSLDGDPTILDENLKDLNGLSYDEESGKSITVHVDLCFDVATYCILKFKFDEDAALADLVKGATKSSGGVAGFEIEILGKDNAKIDALCVHIEEWHVVPECTRKYTSDQEDENADDANADGNANGIDISQSIDIETYFINMLVNETDSIRVTELPEGYSSAEVVYSVDAPEVVSVDQNGNVKALAAGQAEITVSTKDGRFEIKCAIIVNEESKIEIAPLPGVIA